MKIIGILKKGEEEKKNILYNLLNSYYFGKIERWKRKGVSEDDAFDKYLNFFIALNIAYNLWANIDNPNFNPIGSDASAFKKIGSDLLNDLGDGGNSYLQGLINILDSNHLFLNVGTQNKKEDIKNVFARAHASNDVKKIKEIAWESFYSARCNLVHGVKGYEIFQAVLLGFMNDELLKHIEEIIKQLKILSDLLTINLKIKKDCEFDSVGGGGRYKIISNDDVVVKIKRLNAVYAEREYPVKMSELLEILTNFYGKRGEINTSTIDLYVSGRESLAMAILKHCEIVEN